MSSIPKLFQISFIVVGLPLFLVPEIQAQEIDGYYYPGGYSYRPEGYGGYGEFRRGYGGFGGIRRGYGGYGRGFEGNGVIGGIYPRYGPPGAPAVAADEYLGVQNQASSVQNAAQTQGVYGRGYGRGYGGNGGRYSRYGPSPGAPAVAANEYLGVQSQGSSVQNAAQTQVVAPTNQAVTEENSNQYGEKDNNRARLSTQRGQTDPNQAEKQAQEAAEYYYPGGNNYRAGGYGGYGGIRQGYGRANGRIYPGLLPGAPAAATNEYLGAENQASSFQNAAQRQGGRGGNGASYPGYGPPPGNEYLGAENQGPPAQNAAQTQGGYGGRYGGGNGGTYPGYGPPPGAPVAAPNEYLGAENQGSPAQNAVQTQGVAPTNQAVAEENSNRFSERDNNQAGLPKQQGETDPTQAENYEAGLSNQQEETDPNQAAEVAPEKYPTLGKKAQDAYIFRGNAGW